MVRVLCLCVETLQFGRGIPSIWCVKNLTCILEHVVYGLCGLACLMHHRLISKNVVHLSNSVGPCEMMERAEFGSWSLNLTRAMQRLGFQRSPLTQTRNILFYLTDRCATDVVPYIYIFTSFSLQFTVLATSGFPFPVVCTIPPWLLSPSFHATCCAGRPKFSFCVFFFNAFCESSSVEPGVPHPWPDSKRHHYFSVSL